MESRDVEEQLRTTLHCDDKEKLRRKLSLLKREYLKTAQRLQRAERSEGARRHVRSRVSQQNVQDRGEVTSKPSLSPVTLNGTNAATRDKRQSPGHAGVVRLLLPSGADCLPSPDPSHDAVKGLRPSPALRLRSRRSRLLWERRSAEACRITDGEEVKEQSEKLESATTEAEEENMKSGEEEVVNESEDLCSSEESDSPSLLLTHWKTHTEAEGKEEQGDGEQSEKEDEATTDWKKESTSLLQCQNSRLHTEERERGPTADGEREEGDSVSVSDENMKETATEKKEDERIHNDTMEIKEGKNAGLLDSCTLVEGLLFPVEYYVRTTRRMTSSQSQPDMQAVLRSQLSAGCHRRSRGRGLGSNGHPHASECSDLNTQEGSSSPVDPSVELPANSQRSSETSSKSQNGVDASPSPAVSATDPGAGRSKRRRRGRGRGQTPRSSKCLDIAQPETSEDPGPSLTRLSHPPSPHAPDGRKRRLTPQDQPVSTCLTGPQPSPGVNGAQRVFPLFLMKNTPSQRSRGASSWRSLLLPPSPLAQTSLLPLPSPSTGSLLSNLMTFDIHQDFHLPDDQFASLKLHKLRQVAVESGLELFTSPSYNTRSRLPRSYPSYGTGDPVVPLPLPLSLTPTVSMEEKPSSVDAPKNLTTDSNSGKTETPREQQTESPEGKTHTETESLSVVLECPPDCVVDTEEQEPVDTHSQSNTQRSTGDSVKPQPDTSCADGPAGEVDGTAEEDVCSGVVCSVEDQRSTNHRGEDRAVVKTLCFECPPEETAEDAVKHPTSSSEATTQRSSPHPSVNSQLLSSPPLTSAHCPFTAPHLPSSALLSSPTMPSIGLTPRPVSACLPLTSSPSAPALALPPPHSPATQDLSPPALSPYPSIASLPPSQPAPSGQDRASSLMPAVADHHPSLQPATVLMASGLQSQGTGRQEGERTEEQRVITHTLKAPAGGCLVDTCCLPGPSGGLCVAAAGKWAVCLWSQTPTSGWSLTHTWTFNYRVINVFPVPDAAGLLFVTLGQLEIREVRVLSCSSLTQVLLREGAVQVVVGVSGARVVTSSHSATGSTLRVFNVSDDNSTPSSQPLVSPGVCVGALAAVDGLSDALIGTDEGGRVFVWNLASGQLLRSIVLGDGFSHTACLRGYSHSGVLFVLLQHQLLSSLEDVEMEVKAKEEDGKKTAFFSLVAVNPLSGKSVLATQLYPPEAWSGRLCEADVNSSSVVGLSQSGCACVWELGRPGASRMVWAPESEGWQLARWGGADTLVTGHHKGDVTVHRYSQI